MPAERQLRAEVAVRTQRFGQSRQTAPHPPLNEAQPVRASFNLPGAHSRPEPGQSPSVDGVSSTNQRPSQERPMAKVTASSCEPPSRTAPVR